MPQPRPSRILVYEIVERTCPRFPTAGDVPIYRRVRDLIGAEAWLPLVHELLAWRLPRWRVRRTYHEAGEWHCVIGLRWTPADRADTPVVSVHRVPELAALLAYVEALERGPDLESPFANVVPLSASLRPRRACQP